METSKSIKRLEIISSLPIIFSTVCFFTANKTNIVTFSADFLWAEDVEQSEHRIPLAVNLSFQDWSRYFFFQVAPQLSSQG
jgi:hypothetical protein